MINFWILCSHKAIDPKMLALPQTSQINCNPLQAITIEINSVTQIIMIARYIRWRKIGIFKLESAEGTTRHEISLCRNSVDRVREPAPKIRWTLIHNYQIRIHQIINHKTHSNKFQCLNNLIILGQRTKRMKMIMDEKKINRTLMKMPATNNIGTIKTIRIAMPNTTMPIIMIFLE